MKDERFTQLQLATSYTIGRRDFQGCDFSYMHLSKFCLAGCSFIGANFTGCHAEEANFEGCTFDDSNLSGFKTFNTRFVGSSFINANAQRACFIKADLREATLVNVDFSFGDLSGANLLGAVLEGCKLETCVWKSEILTSSGETYVLEAWPKPNDPELKKLEFLRWLVRNEKLVP